MAKRTDIEKIMRDAEKYVQRKEKESSAKNNAASDVRTYKSQGELGYLQAESQYLNDRITSANKSISNLHSNLQSSTDLLKQKRELRSTLGNLRSYQKYMNKYMDVSNKDTFNREMDSIASMYESALRDYGNLEDVYGQFANGTEYRSYMAKQALKNKYANYSYEQIQDALKKAQKGSEEYNYLSEYMDYSDLRDFDKALANAKDDVGYNYNANDYKMFVKDANGKLKLNQNMDYGQGAQIERDNSYKNRLQQARNVYAIENKFDLYKDYLDKADFAEGSAYDPNVAHDVRYTSREKDKRVNALYAHLNGEGDNSQTFNVITSGYDLMTDEEKAVFNYKYKVEGIDSASDYLDEMDITLSKRRYDSETQQWEEFVDKGKGASVVASAMSVPYKSLGALTSGIETVKEVATGHEFNPYASNRIPTNFAYDTRNYVAENIEENTEGMDFLGVNVPSQLYQLGMSGADQLTALALGGGAYSAIMGMDTATITARELKEDGASGAEIAIGSIGAGLFEMVFEKVSIDKLINMKSADSVMGVVTNALKQAGVEATEEMATEVSNILLDTISRGEASDAYEMYQEYIDQGYSEEEARKMVASELGKQIAWSGIGGALLGGGMGGGLSVAQSVAQKKAEPQTEAVEQTAPEVDETIEPVELSTEPVELTGENSIEQTSDVLDNTEAELDPEMTDLEAYAEGMTPHMAQTFHENYKGEDAKGYALAFNLAYQYGSEAIGIETAIKNKGVLSESQAMAIYKAGIESRGTNVKQARINALVADAQKKGIVGKTKGAFKNDGSVDVKKLTPSQRTHYNFLEQFSNAFGINVTVTLKGEKENFNGHYVRETNTITIDLNAFEKGAKGIGAAVVPTLTHEVTHWMKNKAPKAYQALQEGVLNVLTANSTRNADQLIEEEIARLKSKGHSSTREDAIDEIVARACEDMLAGSEKMKELTAHLDEATKKTVKEKIKQLLDEVKAFLTKLYHEVSGQKEAKFLWNLTEEFNEIQKKWDAAFGEAVEANRAVDFTDKSNDVQFADRAKVGNLSDKLLPSEWKLFTRLVAEYNAGNKFQIASNGDIIIPVNNKLVYTDANIENPGISKVIEFYSEYETEVDVARRKIYEAEKRNESTLEDAYKIIESYYGHGFVNEYTVRNSKKNGRFDRRTERGKSKSDAYHANFMQDRVRRAREIAGFVDDVQFSDRDVEQTRELVALHNLSEEKLNKVLELGGIPMPSLAITKASIGHTNFGGISLVFGKETIDPKFFRSNRVYSGDAWTPTYPTISYKLNEKVQEKIKKKVDSLVPENVQRQLGGLHLDSDNMESTLNRHGGDMVNAYRHDTTMKYVYLVDTDQAPEFPQTEAKLDKSGYYDNGLIIRVAEKYGWVKLDDFAYKGISGNEELISELRDIANAYTEEQFADSAKLLEAIKDNPIYGEDNFGFTDADKIIRSARIYLRDGIKLEFDRTAVRKMVDEATNQTEYDAWLTDLFSGVVEKKGIRNDKDMFTPSGNRRKWEVLHYEETLENVIKAMKEDGEKGIGMGNGNIFGASTTEFESINDIREAGKNLKLMTEEEHSEMKQEFQDRFFELAKSLPNSSSFLALDDASKMLVEAVVKHKTRSGIANYLRKESQGWAKYSEDVVDELIALVNDIRNMPTSYFEAKPRRAVGFDEIKAAIIPDDTSENLKAKLSEANIPIREYKAGDNEARKAIIQSMDDVMFSDRDTQNIYDEAGETERLKKENKMLRELVAELRDMVANNTATGSDLSNVKLNAIAGHLRNVANSTVDKARLVADLRELYAYIMSEKDATEADIFERALYVSRKVLMESKGRKNGDAYAQSVLDEIKSRGVKLNDAQIKEAKILYGNRWHQILRGCLNIKADGIPLDSQWSEWAKAYPDTFEAVGDTEQINHIVDIVNNLKETANLIENINTQDNQRAMAVDILEDFWQVAPLTKESRESKDFKKLKFDHRKSVQAAKDYYKDLEEKSLRDAKEQHRRVLEEVRARYEKREKESKELHKKRMDDYKENLDKKATISKVTKTALTLNKWINENSKNHPVPEVLKKPVVALLSAIDFSSKQMLNHGIPTKKDESLTRALDAVRNMATKISTATITADETKAAYDGFIDFPKGFAEDVNELADKANEIMRQVGNDNGYVLNQMTAEELESLNKILNTMKHTITTLNRCLATRTKQEITALATSTIDACERIGDRKNRSKGVNLAKDTLNYSMALPVSVFDRFGAGGKTVFASLQDGWDKFSFNIKQIIDFAEKAYTSKEVKEWSTSTLEFEILDATSDKKAPKYNKVKMTVAQAMSLYCLYKRPHAKQHLLAGGIRVATFKDGKVEFVQSRGTTISDKEIKDIIAKLTPRQIEVADKLQEFMVDVCAEWGNKVSMIRHGYKAFGEEHYFPIKVEMNGVITDQTNETENSLFRILNMGFTKKLNPQADNKIVLCDIFDVFTAHASDMAKYNALALPVLDMIKWYNYRERVPGSDGHHDEFTLKKSLENAFGNKSKEYITKFLKDINGSHEISGDTGFIKTLVKNYKVAAVAGNLRVALLQPTSIVRALCYINGKYIGKAVASNPKRNVAKAEKYCGIAQWKALGFYDTSIQRGLQDIIKHENNAKDKVVDLSLKPVGLMDKLTWGYLWKACEYEVADKQKNLKVGSEEFYQAVADRLREVIYHTQVVDSTMTRSQIMRDRDGFAQLAMPFMSEPTVAFNMLADAFHEWSLDAREQGSYKKTLKKHGKNFARRFGAYTLTAGASAVVMALMEALRDDRDDEEKEKEAEKAKIDFLKDKMLVQRMVKNFKSSLNPLNSIPIIKDAVSTFETYFETGTWYDNARMETAFITSTVSAVHKTRRFMEDEATLYKTVYSWAKAFSQTTGIPIGNTMRDAVAMWNQTIGEIYPNLKIE